MVPFLAAFARTFSRTREISEYCMVPFLAAFARTFSRTREISEYCMVPFLSLAPMEG